MEKQREPNGDQNFKLKNNQPFDEFHTQQLNLWLVHKTQLELKTYVNSVCNQKVILIFQEPVED